MAAELTVDLIDYGGGNLGSIRRCLDRLGVAYRLATGDAPPSGERPLVFPGVGAFGAAMANLERSGLADVLRVLVRGGTPYLGICIGLQVLFEASEEAPGTPGLGLVPGQVVRFSQGKVPQIGWNAIESPAAEEPPGFVYFVNSYYPRPEEPGDVLYRSDYHGPFCAAIRRGNIVACQFHPEKSGHFGHALLERWLHALAR